MKPAEEAQKICDGLWFWQAYDPSVKTDLSCCAVQTKTGLVFIDPIPLQAEALAEVTSAAPPAAIVLTNGNHARAATEFRTKFALRIFAHRAAEPDLIGIADEWLDDGAKLFDEFSVVALPGFAPGEIALHRTAGGGQFFMGDALINVASHGFVPLPAKYCADAKLACRSLQKLLQFDFDFMTFAHGLPILAGAKSQLAELLS